MEKFLTFALAVFAVVLLSFVVLLPVVGTLWAAK